MGMTYELGRSMGRHRKGWAIAAVCVISVLWINFKIFNEAEEKRQIVIEAQDKKLQTERSAAESIAAAGAAVDAAAIALKMKCTSDVTALVVPAKDALLRGNPDDALKLLKPCATMMTDKEALRTYAAAQNTLDKKLAIAEAKNLADERKRLKSEKALNKSRES